MAVLQGHKHQEVGITGVHPRALCQAYLAHSEGMKQLMYVKHLVYSLGCLILLAFRILAGHKRHIQRIKLAPREVEREHRNKNGDCEVPWG